MADLTDELADAIADILRPYRDRIAALEAKETEAKQQRERHREHLARLETRLAKLERTAK